jgi:AraC-like DNA-binding protein
MKRGSGLSAALTNEALGGPVQDALGRRTLIPNTTGAQHVVLDSLGRVLNSLESFNRGYKSVIVEVSRVSDEMAITIRRDGAQDRCISLVLSTRPNTAADDAYLTRAAFGQQSRAEGAVPEVSSGSSADAAMFTFDATALKVFCALLRRCYVAYGAGNRYIRGGLAPARLHRVLSYIDANLGERNDLHTLAKLAGVSVHHFAHAFKQSTGLSPHKYVLEQRMKQAQQLLQADKSILEISHILGFCNQAHFTRTFTREIGASPGYYLRIIAERDTGLEDARPLTRKKRAKKSP